MDEKSAVAEEMKPGTGVDRTQIQQLLRVSPAERLRMLVVESRNVSALLSRIKRR
jgi:hypothetical protein